MTKFVYNLNPEIERTQNLEDKIKILEGCMNDNLENEYGAVSEEKFTDEEKQNLLKSFEKCLVLFQMFKLYKREIVWEGDNFYVDIRIEKCNPYERMSFHHYNDNTILILKTKYIRSKEPNKYGVYIIKDIQIDSKLIESEIPSESQYFKSEADLTKQLYQIIDDIKPYLDLPIVFTMPK